jgi:histidine triad (HIT) family protein
MYPPLSTDRNLVDTVNVFREIIAGRSESSTIYRDARVIAIMDIQPVNPGHVLVIPLQPARFLSELDDTTAAHLFKVARWISLAIRHTDVLCEGVNLFLADGASAGQEVPHVHLHVFPRYQGDGFGLKLPERYFASLPKRSELDAVAAKIQRTLANLKMSAAPDS